MADGRALRGLRALAGIERRLSRCLGQRAAASDETLRRWSTHSVAAERPGATPRPIAERRQRAAPLVAARSIVVRAEDERPIVRLRATRPGQRSVAWTLTVGGGRRARRRRLSR